MTKIIIKKSRKLSIGILAILQEKFKDECTLLAPPCVQPKFREFMLLNCLQKPSINYCRRWYNLDGGNVGGRHWGHSYCEGAISTFFYVRPRGRDLNNYSFLSFFLNMYFYCNAMG